METILTIWRLLEVFGMLAVPLLLGVLGYFRLRKYHDFMAHLVGFIIPPCVFFCLAWVMLGASLQQVQARGERVCGLAAGMMGLMVLLGTGVQMFFSLMAQLILHGRHPKNNVAKQI
jgi:hypothetical protein